MDWMPVHNQIYLSLILTDQTNQIVFEDIGVKLVFENHKLVLHSIGNSRDHAKPNCWPVLGMSCPK